MTPPLKLNWLGARAATAAVTVALPVAAALIVIVLAVTLTMVELAGMPVPVIAWPTWRPAVEATPVSTALPVTVVTESAGAATPPGPRAPTLFKRIRPWENVVRPV